MNPPPRGAQLGGVSPDELEILARAHQAEVYRYLRYLGADPLLAEELGQEVLLAAYEGNVAGEIAGWEDRRQAGWLRGVARNLFLLHHRKQARRKERADSELVEKHLEASEGVWVTEFLREGDGFDYLEALRGCLGKLNERQREVVEGFYGRGESREAVGEKVGMTVDGVKTTLRRLRAGLADCVRTKLGIKIPPGGAATEKDGGLHVAR